VLDYGLSNITFESPNHVFAQLPKTRILTNLQRQNNMLDYILWKKINRKFKYFSQYKFLSALFSLAYWISLQGNSNSHMFCFTLVYIFLHQVENQATWFMLVQNNVFSMQHTPQLLPLPKGQKKREMKTSSLNRDCESRPWRIMCLKWSYFVFRTNILFFVAHHDQGW
jgi:hypothetical protein